jgi:sec-independent protein translocase protein TatA
MVMDMTIYQAAIGGLGPWELAIILVVVLIVFGAGKLPKVGASLGEALKNFKKSVNPADEEDKKEDEKKKLE